MLFRSVAVIEGIPGATQSEARKNGAVEAFKKAGMDLLAVQAANFDRRQAYDLTAALADANPDLAGIACGNDIMALGAVEALKKKGMKDKVVVVGVDFIEEAKASIERGELDATVAMSPYLLGKTGTILRFFARIEAEYGHRRIGPDDFVCQKFTAQSGFHIDLGDFDYLYSDRKSVV